MDELQALSGDLRRLIADLSPQQATRLAQDLLARLRPYAQELQHVLELRDGLGLEQVQLTADEVQDPLDGLRRRVGDIDALWYWDDAENSGRPEPPDGPGWLASEQVAPAVFRVLALAHLVRELEDLKRAGWEK